MQKFGIFYKEKCHKTGFVFILSATAVFQNYFHGYVTVFQITLEVILFGKSEIVLMVIVSVLVPPLTNIAVVSAMQRTHCYMQQAS